MGNLLDPTYKPDNYYTSSRLEMLEYVPENAKRILDVGCGAGEFGKALKSRRSVEVWGVEFIKQAADEAQFKLDKVIVGSIEDSSSSLPEGYFDCVVFNDVLEHLIDPWSVLTKIKAYMKPGAYVVASIPNVRYFENIKKLIIQKQWEYEDCGPLDKTHLRFFTSKSVVNLFTSVGYSVNSLEGINGRKFPWKFNLMNLIMLNAFSDMRYLQFVCLAQLKTI